MRRRLRPLLALLLCAGPAGAQVDSVDAFVAGFLHRRAIPAAAIAVVHHGRVVRAAGYGLADPAHGIAATAHTAFEIGSITKQFTAEAVMMLVEQGRLDLDDPLARWLPGTPDAWRDIRLRHLLTHTSGLHDWEGDTTFSLRREYTLEEFIAFVARHPLDFPPGTRFAYTNSAYPLLGRVVEVASGVPFERFVRERVFAPAGMVETRFRHNGEEVPRRAAGFVDRDGALVPGEPLRPRVLAPNGLILSSAADMGQWLVALSRGALVRQATIDAMTAPTRLADGTPLAGVGIAWFLASFRGHPFRVHNGSTAAGFSSVVYWYPDDDLGVVVLLDIDRWDAVNVLATSVAGFWVPGVSMRSLPPRPDPDPLLSARLLALLADVAHGRRPALLAPRARADSTLGFDAPASRITFLEVEDPGAAGASASTRQLRRYRVEGGGRIVYYTFELAPDGTVMRLVPEEP